MKKKNEIVAIKVSGIDILKVSWTTVALSLIIVIITFFVSEMLVPVTSSRSNEIWNRDVEKRDPTHFYGSSHIWYKASDAIYWIKHFDSKNNVMSNPTFYFFDSAFRLIKKIDGMRCIWEADTWKIEEGIVQDLQTNGEYALTRFQKLSIDIPETPDTFVRAERKPEEMNIWQLRRYGEQIRLEGYDNTKYKVDMNIKIAFPFISLVLATLGVPLALSLNKGGTPLAVAIGIGICFLYMVMLGLSRSLGLSGILPSILSAWSANIVFFLLGIHLMLRIER